MKRKLSMVSAAAVIALCGTASATGLPVFDGANFAQAVHQVAAWKKQYDQMVQQQQQLLAQHAAMTGSRGLGAIKSDPRLSKIVPADVASNFKAIHAQGASALTALGKAIRDSAKLYDCENRADTGKSTCQAFLNTNAQAQAYQQNALELLAQRATQLQTLQAQIDKTNDPKSIAELQARLQVEASQVANDNNRLLVMKAMAESADRQAQQAIRERQLKNFALQNDGSDTFVYKQVGSR